MKQPDGSRNAPPAIIAILIGLARTDVPRRASVDQHSDVDGFAIPQPSPTGSLLPASRIAWGAAVNSWTFEDVLISSVRAGNGPA